MARTKKASPLTTARAVFVYEAARLAAAAASAPVVPEPWQDRDVDFQLQFLAVVERQCGDDRFAGPEQAHQSWVDAYTEMGWVYGPARNTIAKTHPDLVPFAELEEREQDKDAVFLALCDIARQWIRE